MFIVDAAYKFVDFVFFDEIMKFFSKAQVFPVIGKLRLELKCVVRPEVSGEQVDCFAEFVLQLQILIFCPA